MTERARVDAPALVIVAHGSRDPRAASAVEALAARIRAGRPDVDVMVAYLEHARPALGQALGIACQRGHREAVVVPLLLASAYHSKIDLPRQLGTALMAPPETRLAPVLGPDPVLLALVERRLLDVRAARGDPRWGVVVAAAGSTDPGAVAEVAALAGQLSRRGWGTVVAGFAATAEPSVPEAVGLVREAGAHRVAIASYLLTPGRFSQALRCAGADVVSAPLADSVEVAGLVLRRYDAALLGDGVDRRPVGGLALGPAAGVALGSAAGVALGSAAGVAAPAPHPLSPTLIPPPV